MTPEERKLLIKDIVDVLDARVIKPLERRIDDRLARIEQNDKRQDAAFAPKAKLTDVATAQEDTLRAAGAHMDRLANTVESFRTEVRAELRDTNSRLTAIEKQGAASFVEVTDARGTVSLVPAAQVAAKAAVRAEGKTAAVEIAANRADTQSLSAKVSAHRAFIALVIQIVALGLWQAYQAISHHAP